MKDLLDQLSALAAAPVQSSIDRARVALCVAQVLDLVEREQRDLTDEEWLAVSAEMRRPILGLGLTLLVAEL